MWWGKRTVTRSTRQTDPCPPLATDRHLGLFLKELYGNNPVVQCLWSCDTKGNRLRRKPRAVQRWCLDNCTTLQRYVRENLECPCCRELPEGGLVQCYMGHVTCSTCRAQLETCPLCRGQFNDDASTRLLRGIILAELPEKCPAGCLAVYPRAEKNLHRDVCYIIVTRVQQTRLHSSYLHEHL